MDIKIDPEFEALCPPLTDDELNRLENGLSVDGCLSPLIVWKEWGILLDGHNRKRICDEQDIEYSVKAISLDCRAQAFNWIICNQLGRRNLSPDQRKALIGMRYNAEKKQGSRSDLTSDQNEQKLDTADRIAKGTGVSSATVKRAGAAVAAMSPDEIKDVMSGKAKMPKKKRRAKGSKDGWEKFKDITGRIVKCVDELSSILPHVQWRTPARDLLEGIMRDITKELERITS